MSENKVSKPSSKDFYHGITHGRDDESIAWGLILGKILRRLVG